MTTRTRDCDFQVVMGVTRPSDWGHLSGRPISALMRTGRSRSMTETLNHPSLVIIWECHRSCDSDCLHRRPEGQSVSKEREFSSWEGHSLIRDIAELEPGRFVMSGDVLARRDHLQLIDLGRRVGIAPWISLTPTASLTDLRSRSCRTGDSRRDFGDIRLFRSDGGRDRQRSHQVAQGRDRHEPLEAQSRSARRNRRFR